MGYYASLCGCGNTLNYIGGVFTCWRCDVIKPEEPEDQDYGQGAL